MHNGRSMANVTADQLKETGLALPQYIRLWDKTGARPAAGAGGQADTKKEAVIKEVRDRILKSRAGALAGKLIRFRAAAAGRKEGLETVS
jgi:hypothetical protein